MSTSLEEQTLRTTAIGVLSLDDADELESLQHMISLRRRLLYDVLQGHEHDREYDHLLQEGLQELAGEITVAANEIESIMSRARGEQGVAR